MRADNTGSPSKVGNRHASASESTEVCRVGLLAAAISIGAPLGIFGGHGELALNVVWLGAILASIKGILSLPRSARGPWLLVAASLILMLVGAALREHYNTLGDVSTQRSLIPDLAAGPGYLLLVAAMAGIVRDRRRGVDGGVDTLLDGLLCGLASLALAWVYVLEPAIATTPMPFGSGLSVIGYLAVSVVLVVLTAQLAFSAGERLIVSQVFAVVAMLFMLIGDLLYTLTDARLISLDASVVMTPYALTFSSLTYMYLHPSMGEFAQPIPPQRKIASPTRLAFVAVALLGDFVDFFPVVTVFLLGAIAADYLPSSSVQLSRLRQLPASAAISRNSFSTVPLGTRSQPTPTRTRTHAQVFVYRTEH